MKYIISAERYNLSVEENRVRTMDLVGEMLDLGLTFLAVQGVYKGVSERSFLVFQGDMPEEWFTNWIHHKMDELDQESIRVIDQGNKASLVYADGRTLFLGEFQKYDGDLVGLDAYTSIAGDVWVCA